MDEFYIISYDKNKGGEYFFFTGTPKEYNTSIKNAKMYEEIDTAIKEARKLLLEIGFKHTLYVHKWTPSTFMGTEIVKRI
jgi:hypothetical protein